MYVVVSDLLPLVPCSGGADTSVITAASGSLHVLPNSVAAAQAASAHQAALQALRSRVRWADIEGLVKDLTGGASASADLGLKTPEGRALVPLAAHIRRLRAALVPDDAYDTSATAPLLEPQWDAVADTLHRIDATLAAAVPPSSTGAAPVTSGLSALPPPLQGEIAAVRTALDNRALASALAAAFSGAGRPTPAPGGGATLSFEAVDAARFDALLAAARDTRAAGGLTAETGALVATARLVRALRLAARGGAYRVRVGGRRAAIGY